MGKIFVSISHKDTDSQYTVIDYQCLNFDQKTINQGLIT